jgi:hypothetical protein
VPACGGACADAVWGATPAARGLVPAGAISGTEGRPGCGCASDPVARTTSVCAVQRATPAAVGGQASASFTCERVRPAVCASAPAIACGLGAPERNPVALVAPDGPSGRRRLTSAPAVQAKVSAPNSTDAARLATAAVRGGAQDKGPVLERGVRFLGRFSTHLDSEKKGVVDRKAFFPEDGTAGGVGRSAPRVLIALGRIEEQLATPECRASDKGAWHDEAAALRAELTPVVEHSQNARTERSTVTPELEAVRQAWLQTYVAAKNGVECVLRLSGKLHLMPVIFYDLAVPGPTKVTEPPPDPPA